MEHPGEMVKDCIMTIKGEKYFRTQDQMEKVH